MANVLEVESITKHFKSFDLGPVSFALEEGTITGFIGANGAGKTSTIKSILDALHIDGGSIKLFGMPNSLAASREDIGVVLDEGCFYEFLTLSQMRSIVAGAYKAWDESRYRELIQRFSLPASQEISKLSKGMRMKFALALALSHHAKLLIMDEPTSGLDPLVRSELIDILAQYRAEENGTVLFSTHITSDLSKIADYIILIDNGRIVLDSEKDALLDSHLLVKGSTQSLTPELKKQLIGVRTSAFDFEALCANPAYIRAALPDALFTRPDIDDIMLHYVGRIEDADKFSF